VFQADLVIERISFGFCASMRKRLEVNIFELRLLVWREHTGLSELPPSTITLPR
jgi:hypothetical protein